MPHQDEWVPNHYKLVSSPGLTGGATRIELRSDEGPEGPVTLVFKSVKEGLFRVTFFSDSHPLPPFPSAHRPELEFLGLKTVESGDFAKTFHRGDIEARIDWTDVPVVSIGYSGHPPLHEDLPHRSYVFDGPGTAHYTKYARGDLHVGLGEKAAPMDLSNRNFTLSATDCFGYDALRSDPMYKHIPLLIRATPHGVVGTFSASHARGYSSVGSEMDGMWGYFKAYRQDFGGLDEYILVGKTLQEVVTIYANLVGYPLLVPRWSFGYLAGGMKYSMLDPERDSIRAHDALIDFASKLVKHDIPCSGFQLSSGYTMSQDVLRTRNVFTWNRQRFPDPSMFAHEFHLRGIKLIANIKPYVLKNHPEYNRLEASGAFFRDPRTGKSGVARLWSSGGGTSGEGGHIDFTSEAGYAFWYNGVKELRKTGMDCMWNDNNEYLVPSDKWELALEHPAVAEGRTADSQSVTRKDIGLWGRAMQTELHGKCSHDALLEVSPNERPFVLTRSATAGTMKYACSSWSGDNVSSWDGMRGANAISLNAGMCLLQCYGHDIGGFEGPQPSPELLLRWVQLGCHSPRFAINCYKTTQDSFVGDVIEPWMYPEITPHLRRAIKRRYELIPYLYSLMLKSHHTAVPPQRWTGWGYEQDPEIWRSKILKDGETQYWLGDSLLIGGVYEPNVNEAEVYLPRRSHTDPGFLNTNAPHQFMPAGEWEKISSPWKGSIPVLARIGGAVPVGKNVQVAAPGDTLNKARLPIDDYRGVEIFPPLREHSDRNTWYTNEWLEDDGISPPPVKCASFVISYLASYGEVVIDVHMDIEDFVPPWLEHGLIVILPVGDGRQVLTKDEKGRVEPRRADEHGRRRVYICLDHLMKGTEGGEVVASGMHVGGDGSEMVGVEVNGSAG